MGGTEFAGSASIYIYIYIYIYDLWGLKFSFKKIKYMAIGDMSKDVEQEDSIGTINHVREHIYMCNDNSCWKPQNRTR